MSKGYMYILGCRDGSYYTGSTVDLDIRLRQHADGIGAKYTARRLPVRLLYYEEFLRIEDAFYREKQVQGWSRNKKESLIVSNYNDLSKFAQCQNETHYNKDGASATLSHREANSKLEDNSSK